MLRSKAFSLCVAMVIPFCQAIAFWGYSEKMSPKAERAKKVLEDFGAEVEKSMRDYQVPGSAIGIIVDGYVVYAKGFGMRDLDKKLPVTPDTRFLIGSITKGFTAFAVGCLVDEGLLRWDDRMVDIVPEFRLSDQYVTQVMTIRDLLSHQTRLPRHDYMWYNSDLTRSEVFHRIRYLDLASDSCDHFHYNNLMYLAVGVAAEKVTSKSYESLIKEKILSPLHMTQTGFSAAEMQKTADYSFPYVERDNAIKKMNFRDFTLVAPGACMYSNITDLCQWAQLHLHRGEWEQKPLISLATFKEMQAPQVVATGYPESKEEQVRAYGLGWYVQSYQGNLNVMHDGALDGFTSFISLLPSKDVGVVVLSNKNLTAWPRLIAMEVFDRVLELPKNDWLKEGLLGVEKNKEMQCETQTTETKNRKQGTHPSHPLSEYSGEYEHPAYGRIKVECVDNALRVNYHNLEFRLDHWHYDVFNVVGESEDTLISVKNMKFTFHNNLNGDVDEISVPFEQKSPDVVFTRRPDDSLTASAYLRQFTGIYEIYSYTVEIKLINHSLYAIIPGQPLYELVPSSANEFSIKSLTGFAVRFDMENNQQVKEVLLIQPYGLVYSAKPKR